MPDIHPSSVIMPGASVADDAHIGPFCYVGPKVTIGSGTRLLSHVHIDGRTTLGKQNTISPHTVLGGAPQDLKYHGEDTELRVGDRNDIREGVTLNLGTANDAGLTSVGSDNLIMAYVHVGHDCRIGDHCVIANCVQLAGHVTLESHANIGGATAVHHFVTIGGFAFVAGMTRVITDVPPFMVVEGNPSKVRRVNHLLLKRHGYNDEQIARLKRALRLLYRHAMDDEANGNGHGSGGSASGGRNGVRTTAEAIEVLRSDFPDDTAVTRLLDAIDRSREGIHGRYREALRHDDPYKNPVR